MIVDHRTAARGLAKIGQDGVQRQRGKRLYDSVEFEQKPWSMVECYEPFL